MGVTSGCGCKEVYRFPHITYPPYSSCICSFLQQHPFFFLFFFFFSFFINVFTAYDNNQLQCTVFYLL